MDIVNFPGIIAEHGLLDSTQVNLAKDLILIGKQMGPQRDGTQYENMAITVAQFANIVSGGGNETLAQTLVLGNVTGGNNIIFSGTDFAIFQSGAFSGRLSRLALTGNHAWNLPNKSGTIALLSDIPAPTPTPNLATVLGVGNSTGPINISINSGQGITFNEGAGGVIQSNPTTILQSWFLPDASGTIALLSDIPAAPTTLYSGNGSVTNRTVTITDDLRFNYVSGTKTTQFGVGADPFGWGQGGVLNYFFDTTPGNVDAWGGMFDDFGAGDAAWLHEVYNTVGDSAGFYASHSVAQTNPYSSLYHFEAPGGTYRGFEANKFGEQLYSQRLALVTTALTAADRVLFVSNAGGYIKATTYADLVTQLAIPTFYSANGSTVGNRTVTLGGELIFNHGAAGINGYLRLVSGGYFLNQTSVAGNYFEYNHNDGTFLASSLTHTRTGFKAQRSGVFGEMMTGGGKTYFNTNGYFEWYVNNTGTYAGMLDSTGKWRFGSTTGGVAKVTINGEGNTAATINTLWNNLSGSELMRINDAGQLGINTSDFTTGFGGLTNRFAVRGNNGDYGYHTLGYFENSLNPTANNVYYQRALTASIVKYGTFNTAQMVGSLSVADIQGGGVMNEVYGQHNYIINRGIATVTDMAGIYADKLIQSGIVTNFASVIAHTTQLAGGTITNMYGLWVRTPVNVSGGTRTNTYGVLIEPNATGTNNYGVVSSGQMTNGFGTLTPSLNALVDLATTSKAPLKLGGGMTVAQAALLTAEDSMIIYVTDTNGTFPTVGLYCREAGVWNKL